MAPPGRLIDCRTPPTMAARRFGIPSGNPVGARTRQESPGSRNVRGLAACHPETMRCLIVDDSPRFLEAARGLLEREGIVVVAVATNGADAVQCAAELGPDVILVDINLGGQSGFDVVRRLTHEADLPAS